MKTRWNIWIFLSFFLMSLSGWADIISYSFIQAENYSAMSGVTRSSTEIGSFDHGDFLRYKHVYFGSGANRIRFNASVPVENAGKTIEIRIDSLTGPVIGQLTVQATAGYGSNQIQIASIIPTSGKHVVFLIARGGYGVANLDYFQVIKDTGTTAPTTTTTTLPLATTTTTLPPTPSYLVTVTTPTAGATVSGQIQVKGIAPEMLNVEVFNSARAFLSRATLDSAGNFIATVDTTKLANGVQNLIVIGWDSAAGTAYTHMNEKVVSVNVQNVLVVVPGPVQGPITFERVFNNSTMPLLKSSGGPFYPYFTYFGGDGKTYPEGMPGFRYWNDELGFYSTADYTPAPYDPFKIANGYLSISAIPAYPNYPGSPQPYLTGCLETSNGPYWESETTRSARGGFEQKYGYWEIRARVPKTKGIWPAFWLAGGIRNGITDKQGEIDIFEMIGDGVVYQTVHDWWGGGPGDHKALNAGFDHSADFHTYGLLWTPNEIVWYVDGIETYRASAAMVARYRDLAGPMFTVVNIAVGGSWPGAPDATTKWPAVMDIEYIRVRSL